MSEGGRGQKRGASTAWRVWLPPGNDKQARRALRMVAPLKRGCAVEVHESGKNSVLLLFQKKRAYDSVHGWVSRATGQQIGFRLTCDDDEAQTAPGGGDDEAPPGGDNEALPGGGDADASAAELPQTAQPEETEGTAVSKLSAGFLTLKLAHLLRVSDHEKLIDPATFTREQRGGHENLIDLATLQLLGQGSYGSVYKSGSRRFRYKHGEVAWEALPSEAAAREVAACAALPPHDGIIPLLDVSLSRCNQLLLLLPLYDSNLAAWAEARGAQLHDEEIRHVTVVLLGALGHMHRCGVLHSDVKPSNILVKGPGLSSSGAPTGLAQPSLIYTDSESCASFAEMLGELPSRLRVVLADLGGSRPASSAHRGPGPGLRLARLPEEREEDWRLGVREYLRRTDESPTSLRYRAPEVCLGDWEYGAGVDMWSYGCVLGELVNQEPLLRGETEYDMLLAIFRRFGTPGPDSELARLPLFRQTFPVFTQPLSPGDVWPGRLHDHGDTDLLDLLGQLLLVGPSRRWSAEAALASPYCRRPPLEVQFGAAPAGRGVLSVVQGQLDPRTLHWLQADPCWHGAAGLVGARKKDESMTEKERGVKHEEGGFTRASRPSTVWCNRLDCSKPSRAGRVAAFTRAFINANRAWFDDLTAAIRAKLACFPKAALGKNGEHFMNSSLATDALAYATIQVMRPSEREDRPHFDGAASLLHAGLTVWGRRGVEIRLQPEAEWQRLEQKPGSFYVGNLCAAWHKVVHLPRKDAGPLWREKHKRRGTDKRVHIAVMLRSNVFAGCRSRTTKGRAGPVEVYNVANTAVAQHLAKEGLQLPTFSECVAAFTV